MLRLFDTHHIRQTTELDGMWKVTINEKTYKLPVPACWEQHPDLLSFRGKGEYRKEIYIREDGHVRLEFKGVSHTADVYFDENFVMHHYNAFTPFSGIVTNVKKGYHTVCVKVDNTFGVHSSLHVPNDYYTYGGITRPCGYELIPDVYIKQVHFTPYKADGIWKADIEVSLSNLGTEEKQLTVICELNSVTTKAYVTVQKEAVIHLTESYPEVKSWSGKEPNLYYLNTVLYENETPIDDLIERVGFREVKVNGNHLFLNGERLYFKGFNRHEDYAVEGCAVSLAHMVQDLDLMADMNANAVRTCHYPNDERFLDLCDEKGFFVWEENHARGFSLDKMQNPNFEAQCKDCIDEMINNHYNHPSIVIWGILNECASETPEGREMYKKQYEQIKSLDTSRPHTSATCRHFKDISLDLPDIVSFNQYSGWYLDCDIAVRNDELIDWIYKEGGEGKPIIVSEVGAAAIYGYRDRSRCKWSEERQADIIKQNLDVYMSDDRISGVFLWQFCDCRVTEEEWFPTRARCHNNKGVVDEYRRPKMAYDTIREKFAE